MSSLYILEIKPLSEVSLANIFFLYNWFFFQFNAIFISHVEAFYFDEIPLVYLSCMCLSLGVMSVKILLHVISEIFMPLSNIN